MFPQKRPAFVSVAGETGFVNGILDQQSRPGRTMRIVAIGTRDSARRDRMRGKIMHLRPLRLVAVETNLALRFFGEHFVLRLMNLVARRTGHVVARMRAARPMRALAAGMAIEAGAALHFRRRLVRAAEHEIRHRSRRRVVRVPHMRAAGTMTRLTTRLPGDPVARAVNGKDRLFFVGIVAARADGVAAGALFENDGGVGSVRRHTCQRAKCDGKRGSCDPPNHRQPPTFFAPRISMSQV